MSKLLDTETYEDWRNRWAMEVGRFVLAFGSIESFTYTALRVLPRDPIKEAASSLPLAKRLELLIAIAEARGESKWKEVARHLKRAQALLSHRNVLAHNTLGVLVEFDANDNVVSQIEAIFAERGKAKHILFDRMVEHRKEAESIAQDLIEAQLQNDSA